MKKFTQVFISAATFFLLTIVAFSTLAQAQGSPTLDIVTPSNNQTIYGDRIPIIIAVENFEQVDYKTNTRSAAGQGHIHLWLDDKNPTASSAKMISDNNFTFNDVPFGQHTLRAELVNNNHSSLTPPVVDVVDFKNAPIITPSPTATTTGFDKNTALVILVVVALVIVAAWWYTKEEEEEGESKTSTTKKSSTKRKAARKRQ